MNKIFAAVQNGVILDVFDNYDEAKVRINEEIRKDWLDILLKKKLRKVLKKNGSVSLHRYQVYIIESVEEVSE